MTGNPVAFHAMRGLAAHSNGFQTISAMSILMSILGTIDRPGGFRHKAPFPRPIPPCAKPPPDHLRKRVETHFDPLPFYSQPLETQQSDLHKYPLNAITQRRSNPARSGPGMPLAKHPAHGVWMAMQMKRSRVS